MPDGGSGDQGCGRSASTLYTTDTCPECGAKLRLNGNPRTIKYRLECAACDYQSHVLSVSEVQEIIDR
jgi:hypothetical protein